MNIQVTLLFIVAAINSLLGLFVLLGKRDRTNIAYSIFVVFASFWTIGLAFFILEQSLYTALYIADFYYVSALGIPVFFLYFSLIFLNNDFEFKKKHLFIFLPLLILILLFFYNKYFLLENIFMTSWGKDVVINHFNYLIYAIFFGIYVALSYINLFKSYYSRTNLQERNQLKLILWGTAIGFLFGMTFDLILPFLGDYKHIFVGPIFSLFMVSSITYAITKYRMFDMKVIVAQILVIILWVSILVRTLLSVTVQDQIINGLLLIVTIVIGIFIIKSIKKEIEQKEQIGKLAEELKKVNEGQSSLIHFMNHQIKGRFGITKNIFAELLTDDYGTMPPATLPLLQKGLDEANIGVSYVMGILKGASAESGSLHYDKVQIDFKQIVEEVFNEQKEYAEKKGLKIELKIEDGDYNIMGDKLQMGEAIKNLIDNSINYTPKGNIWVELSQKDGKITLTVKDTGVGITLEDRPNLFKSGGRGVNSLKVNVNATGYGLVFVRGVIKAHGGSVWVESEGRDKGSTFFVEIPKNSITT